MDSPITRRIQKHKRISVCHEEIFMFKSIQTDVSTLAADFGANSAIPPKTKRLLSWASISKQTLPRMSGLGRNSPLGGRGRILSPGRRESATIGQSAHYSALLGSHQKKTVTVANRAALPAPKRAFKSSPSELTRSNAKQTSNGSWPTSFLDGHPPRRTRAKSTELLW